MPVLTAIPPGPHAGRVWRDQPAAVPALMSGCTVRRLTQYRGHSHHLAGPAPCWLNRGRRLVLVSDRDGCGNLFAYDFDDDLLTQLTDLRGPDRPTEVRPAARGCLIFNYGGGAYELDGVALWLRPILVDAARVRARTRSRRYPVVQEMITADGRHVICIGPDRTPLAETTGNGPFAATAPRVSPDGRRVVFASVADGYAQVYAVELPRPRAAH